MFINKLKKINKNIILLISIIFIIFAIKFNFFYNTYLVIKKDAHTRMLDSYGYCYPMGYGFIKDIERKYDVKDESIEVVNKKIFPSSMIFLYNPNSAQKNKKILLNYSKQEILKLNSNFKILENFEDCYLIEYIND